MAFFEAKKRDKLLLYATWINFTNYNTERKKPEAKKKYIMYDTIYMKFKSRQH